MEACKARQQVIQASAGDEIAIQTDHGSALGIVEAQFEIQYDVSHQTMLAAQLVRQQRPEIRAVFTGDLRQYRRQLVLWIDRPALVGISIEVYGKAGNHRNRQLEIDQLAFDPAVAAIGHASSQGQVTVEPWRQQRAAVDFDA